MLSRETTSESGSETTTGLNWRWLLSRLMGLAVWLIAVATFVASFAANFWLADLLVHFRIQYCVVLLLAAVLSRVPALLETGCGKCDLFCYQWDPDLAVSRACGKSVAPGDWPNRLSGLEFESVDIQ